MDIPSYDAGSISFSAADIANLGAVGYSEVDVTNIEAMTAAIKSVGPLKGLAYCVGSISIKSLKAASPQDFLDVSFSFYILNDLRVTRGKVCLLC